MKKIVEVGQIYEVKTENFLAKSYSGEMRDRMVLIRKGERIEIRFPYEWHFRTEIGNVYFQADTESLLKNCKLFGEIWERVRFNNNATLKEILSLKLYDKIK